MMRICSYLVWPREGRRETVAAALGGLCGCEARAATNEDLIVLLTESASREGERELQETLKAFPDVLSYSLTYAHDLKAEQEALR